MGIEALNHIHKLYNGCDVSTGLKPTDNRRPYILGYLRSTLFVQNWVCETHSYIKKAITSSQKIKKKEGHNLWPISDREIFQYWSFFFLMGNIDPFIMDTSLGPNWWTGA